MKLLLITILTSFGLTAIGQTNTDYLYWSADKKLCVEDFGIKKSQSKTDPCFAQFYISHQVRGLDFMTKNFNQKVANSFIKSASWIDTSKHVEHYLRYQQTLFDLAEIYTRKFRQELKENRKQLANGLDSLTY